MANYNEQRRMPGGASMQDTYRAFVRHGYVMDDEGRMALAERLCRDVCKEFDGDAGLVDRICKTLERSLEDASDQLTC